MTRSTPVPVYMQFLTWILLFSLLFFTARGLFSFDRAQYANNAGIDMANMAASDSDVMQFRIERFAAYGIVVAAIGLSLRGTIRAAKENLSIFALPALAILSTFWSQEPTKTASLAIMAFGLTAFAIYLSHRFTGSKLSRSLQRHRICSGAEQLSVGCFSPFSQHSKYRCQPSLAGFVRAKERTWPHDGVFLCDGTLHRGAIVADTVLPQGLHGCGSDSHRDVAIANSVDRTLSIAVLFSFRESVYSDRKDGTGRSARDNRGRHTRGRRNCHKLWR